MDTPPIPQDTNDRGRAGFRRRVVLALAGAACLSATVAGLWRTRRNAPTYTAALAKVGQPRTVRWTVTDARGTDRYFAEGDRTRDEQDGLSGRLVILHDPQTGQQLLLEPDARRVIFRKGLPWPTNPLDTLRTIGRHPTAVVGEQSVNGSRLRGYRGTADTPGPFGRTLQRPAVVWVDEATGLPVRVQYPDVVTGGIAATENNIVFDAPMDDALFDLTPPKGYAVEHRRDAMPTTLRSPPTSQQVRRLVLRPGVGIGDLRLGDPAARVRAVLGEPENGSDAFDKDGSGSYRYPSMGLCVDVRSSGVDFLFAQAGDSAVFPSRPFPGTTDRGIRIGAQRWQVEAAYGKPQQGRGSVSLYDALGLLVYYYDDQQTVSTVYVRPPDQLRPTAATRPTSRPAR